jgi:dihydroorotate dehydrogenase electron transfer subunit
MIKPSLPMKRIEDLKVTGITWLNEENYLIDIQSQKPLPKILPGNFAEIRVDNSPKVFLRRPFSIFDADHKKNILTFYIKILGEGTRLTGGLRTGDSINVIYPLGNSFSLVEKKNVLVIGGGSGVAPFLLLGKELKETGTKVTFLIGGRTRNDIVLTEQLSAYGEINITTEDGSLGEKGMVTDHSIISKKLGTYDKIYTCGPDPMMKAIAHLARDHNTECEASLENMMACGFGACLCCIVETTRGNLCTCTEGPVFNTSELKW